MTRLATRDTRERGTVLLTTLLIMAVMAAVAVAIIDDIRFAVKRMSNVNDYAQLDWYVKGAEDFAGSYIQSNLALLPAEGKNAALGRAQQFSFPFEGGLIGLEVRDGSHCCLLYTSPSPRDLSTSRMPSSA